MKLIDFQVLNLTKFLICLEDLNVGTISGTTQIRIVFSFLGRYWQAFH